MFLTTGEINRTYTIKGIVNATVKKELTSDQLDQVDEFDDLYTEVKGKLIAVRFEPQVVRVSVGPKYLMLHGYGTVIGFPRK